MSRGAIWVSFKNTQFTQYLTVTFFFGDSISIRSQDLLRCQYIIQNKQTIFNINIKYIILIQHTHFILRLKKYYLLVILSISLKDMFRAKKNENKLYTYLQYLQYIIIIICITIGYK